MGRTPSRARIWLALWVVYLVWGSTYLAIRVAVHPTHGPGVPPLFLAGTRFCLAGIVMLAATVRRPAPDGLPDPMGRREWFAAAVIGLALPFGGNGVVSIAERRIPSGTAAVILATIPIWAAVLTAVVRRRRPDRRLVIGLTLGFAGVATLVVGTGNGKVSLGGALLTVMAAFSWAAGSVWSKSAPAVRRPLVMTGMEMLCGGAGCLLVAAISGEFADLHRDQFTAHAWLAWGYLVVFGSLFAYSAYVWLLRHAEISLVTTYAFVNPVVAVILGSLILSEPFTIRSAISTVTVVIGVILMVRRAEPEPVPAETLVREPDDICA